MSDWIEVKGDRGRSGYDRVRGLIYYKKVENAIGKEFTAQNRYLVLYLRYIGYTVGQTIEILQEMKLLFKGGRNG